MRMFSRIACCALLCLSFKIKAQLNGTYSVPGTYTSIAAAISDLNTVGVSGPVIINIAAAYTETVPVGGYTLTATGTSANPITFQKSGVGANPLITAFAGGIATPVSTSQNGIWRMIGSDYITIDGIDLYDPNLSNPSTMEFGYGFFKANGTNGCQYNTIKNCTITLNRINNAGGSGNAVDGSRGIDMVSSMTNSHPSNVLVTSPSGSNSYNKFYGNTIQNCNIGIALIGDAAVSPFTNGDQFNDVGGTSSATGNTIINFGGGGATSPAAAVRTINQWNLNVSYNTINNNNGSGNNHSTTLRGIFINTATSANAAITNNTITVKCSAAGSQLSAIENAAGSAASSNTINISNNLVTNCTYTSTTTGPFYGIYNTASPQVLIMDNNAILNNSTNSSSGACYPLYNTGAATAMISISNNAVNSLSLTAGSTTSIFRGINSTNAGSSSTLSINNNTIQSVSYSGTTATGEFSLIYNTGIPGFLNINLNAGGNVISPTSGSLYGIYNSNSAMNSMISGNTLSNISKTTTGGSVMGYVNVGTPTSGTTSVINNNFSAFSVTGATTLYGINQSANPSIVEIIASNTISAFSSGTGASYGISHGEGATGTTVNNNLVYGFTGTGLVHGVYLGSNAGISVAAYSNTIYGLITSGANTVYGMYYGLGNSASIYKNKIYDLTANNAGGLVVGLHLQASTASNTLNIFNNLIGDLKTPMTSNANAIIGINVSSSAGTSYVNIYFNSVYINAASSAATFGTSGLYHIASATATTAQLLLNNNIIVNTSTPKGTAVTAAFRRSAATLANYNTSSNNNIFYAGVPTGSNVLYHDGTGYQTITAFKALVSPREISSATEFPPFVSTTGSNANFLNLNTGTPTQAESAAIPISGITDDFAGNLRSVTAPDIGAWEGNFSPADLTVPAITNIGYTNPTCNLTTRTVTVNISDVSGVATGSLAPRCYYKVNAGAYTSVQGTLSSGTVNNGVWTFVLTYAATVTDVISYYIAAQDVASTPNVGAMPSAGFSASDVNTVVAPPNTPNTYTITGVLNGTYTVGAGGNFTTLTSAAAAYNSWCITGPVTFVLTNSTYSTSTGETYPIVFGNNPDASSTNSLLIVPSAGNAAVITGATTSAAVIKFLNARYITMNGLNSGGSSLSVNNGNTGTSAAIWMASTTGTGPGCKNLEFTNLNIRGNSTTTQSNYGIVASVDGASPSTTGGMDIDDIMITNNSVVRTGNAIYAEGTASVSAGGLNNWTISNNIIGPASSGTTTIGGNGIYLLNVVNATISSNLIRYINTTGSGISAINLSSGVNTVVVSQNTITTIASSAASSGINSICGIYIGGSFYPTVTKNIISTVYNTNVGGYGARGMMLNAGTFTCNAVIQNNMISDIYSYSRTTGIYFPIGLAIEGISGYVEIDHNSVSLDGSHAGTTGATGSAAFYMNTTGGSIKCRNNIFSNTYNNSNSTTENTYAIYSNSPAGSFNPINYNDYYAGGTGNVPVLGYASAANQLNLAAIQASFGGNLNSQNIAPVFTSSTDLHLIPISNASLDNLGVFLAAITTDIDNQLRSSSTPDMGADEFTAPACSSASGGTQGVSTFTACAGSTLSLNTSGASMGVGIMYQWQVSTVSGGPYTNVSGGTGATTTTYSTGALTAGTYYYVLQATCTSASLTGISNEATVTIVPIPTASISSNSPVCLGQPLTLFGLTDVGTTFSWSGPSAFTSFQQNPAFPANFSSAGNYTFIASIGSCSSTAAVSSVVVNAVPSITTSSTPSVVCLGDTLNLNASGGVTYSWSGPNSFTSSSQNPSIPNIPLTGSGQYTVDVVGANTCTNFAVVNVTVNPLPTPAVFSSTMSMCAGNTATFTATGGTTYSWSTGSTATVIAESPTVTTGYTLTAYSGGCSAAVQFTLYVGANPTVTAISSASIICAGSSVTLTANGASSYTWSSGTMSVSTVESPTATTIYTVTGADAAGCMNTTMITQSVSACTGIIESGSEHGISIYPNPVQNMISVKLENSGPVDLEIVDANGRVVLKAELTETVNQLDISEIANGLYFYIIKNEGSIVQKGKLIKE